MALFQNGLIKRYGGALGILGVTVLARALLDPVLQDRAPYNMLAAAAGGVAWLFGVGPGVFASIAGTGIAWYLFIEPRYSLALPNQADVLQLLGYTIFGIGLSVAIGTARRRHDQTLRQLNRRIQELSTVMDVAPVAIWVAKDPECKDIVGNRMANLFYEASAGENVSATTHPEVRRFYRDGVELSPDELPMQVSAALNKEIRDYGVEVRAPSGMRRYLFGSSRPIHDEEGRVRGSIASYLDLTEMKRVESELRDRTDALARSLSDLQHFTYAANHDLQEPLRMISAYAELLSERVQDRDEVQFASYIRDGAARMRILIDDLLEYSRVAHDTVFVDSVDLRKVVSEALLDLRLTTRECGAEFVIGKLPVLRGDPRQLVQVFENLAANALKYRSPNRPPVISIQAHLEADTWTLCIEDNGIGFDSEYAEQIFEPFQRLHSRREYPGSGLGLAICKRVVERHGGRIWAEGREGQGSSFYFTLPAVAGEWHASAGGESR